jgi:hypothetical protein
MKPQDSQYIDQEHSHYSNQSVFRPVILARIDQSDLQPDIQDRKFNVVSLLNADIEPAHQNHSLNPSSATSAADVINCTSLLFLLFLMISSF